MAKQEQVELLKQGVKRWNQWRGEHPQVCPDLIGAHLSGPDLRGANLYRASLYKASLIEADLREAKLVNVRMLGANLEQVVVNGANF
jgi:hypothetical protein